MAEKKSWKQSAAWVTALKDKPLHKAQLRLTALYVVLTALILVLFVAALSYARNTVLMRDLVGQTGNPVLENHLVNLVSTDLQTYSIILSFFLLLAIGVLGYFSVRLTLQPIRIFLEAHRRFIADASHELRTPLTTMRTEIEVAMLDPEGVSREEMMDILRSNTEEIDRMSRILNNLLNLASFHDVSGDPPMTAVNLKDVVDGTVERSLKYSEPKQVQILTHNVEPVYVTGNATALEEIISNLLKNAVNYSHPGSSVEVALRPLNQKFAELIIKDHGVGIPASELPHIFEPFYRSDRTLHMHKTGAGLGLPIVREMVKRHRGSISVDSMTDQGTVVTITLPLAKKSPVKEVPEIA